jgi:hypothetical protein
MKHSLRTTPELQASGIQVIEIRDAISAEDCKWIETQLPKLLSPKLSNVLDFTGAQLALESVRALESALNRLVARSPRDLWIVGMVWPDGRLDWNHAASVSEVTQWLQSPALAWSRLSQWLENRISETARRTEALLSEIKSRPMSPPSAGQLEARSRKRRSALLTRHIEVRKQATQSGSVAAESASAFTLQKLEEKVIAALASQGVKP